MSDPNDNEQTLSPQQQQQTSTSTGQAQQPASISDHVSFITYLKQFNPALLDANLASIQELDKCFNEKSSTECIKKFLSDSQVRTLIIQRFTLKDDEESEQNTDDTAASQFLISTEINYTNPKCLSVQIIKRGAVVESDKKFHNQVRVISLSDSSPYETLHSYVSNTLAPYFKSYIKRGHDSKSVADSKLANTGAGDMVASSGSAQGLYGGDQFATQMEKKIAEVEMGLLHLQQNIEIPEINLVIHPSVLQIIRKCSDENRKAKVDDFTDKVDDTNFLNQLQSGVNRWIREIKKVFFALENMIHFLKISVTLIITF